MQVFSYDKKRKILIVQSIAMVLVAFVSFYAYFQVKQVLYLVLFAFAVAFIGIYIYRIFVMRIIFYDDKVIYKGLIKQHTLLKKDIYDIQLISRIGREVKKEKYTQGGNYSMIANRTYVLIRKSQDVDQINLSMFNAASDDYISIEYRVQLKPELDKILQQ